MEPQDGLPVFPDTVAWEEAQAALDARELGDGLPLVPPTRRRLDAMLAAAGPPERSFGQVPPLFGELTPAAVAYNCVLAGCRPGELPIVLTAVEASLEAHFNLLGIQTTTGTPAVAVVVHGPAARACALNASTNCLGPGNRANACLGRAVSLVLRNVGGAHPGVGDMATMGQPGKYTFCFAESDDAILSPLHARRGIDAGRSAVTVLGVSGTAEVLPAGNGDSPEAILSPLAVAMKAAMEVTRTAHRRDPGEQVFLLPPELALQLTGHGWTLQRVQHYLFDLGQRLIAGDAAAEGASSRAAATASALSSLARAPGDIHPIVTGGAGIKMTHLPLWAGGTLSVTRAVRELR